MNSNLEDHREFHIKLIITTYLYKAFDVEMYDGKFIGYGRGYTIKEAYNKADGDRRKTRRTMEDE